MDINKGLMVSYKFITGVQMTSGTKRARLTLQ